MCQCLTLFRDLTMNYCHTSNFILEINQSKWLHFISFLVNLFWKHGVTRRYATRLHTYVANLFDQKTVPHSISIWYLPSHKFHFKNLIALDCPKIQLQIATEAYRLHINNRYIMFRNRSTVVAKHVNLWNCRNSSFN